VWLGGKVLFADYGVRAMYRNAFGEEYDIEACKRSF
jgi:hypothetical protein